MLLLEDVVVLSPLFVEEEEVEGEDEVKAVFLLLLASPFVALVAD